LARLRQLAEGDTYRAYDWNLRRDAAGRAYWPAHFRQHLRLLVTQIREQYPDATPVQIEQFRADYLATIQSLDTEPERYNRLDVLLIDEPRRDLLVRYGFEDPFRGIKLRENAAVLKDEAVAARVGGRLFDYILWFQPGRPSADERL